MKNKSYRITQTVVSFQELSENVEDYSKLILSFANTRGGILKIGNKENNLNQTTIYSMIDKIKETVLNTCEPLIHPEFRIENKNNQLYLLVEITKGTNPPYYLKTKGKINGTYIYAGDKVILASSGQIRELVLNTRNQSWDEMRCENFKLQDAQIDKLCNAIMHYRSVGSTKHALIDKEQLVQWKLLLQENGKYAASNAFALFSGDYFSYAKIQCTVYKGKNEKRILAEKECKGPLYEQYEEAYQFVLEHMKKEIVLGKNVYTQPIFALREMIINALVHRNYMEEAPCKIKIFENRIEVESCGTLYKGQSEEDIYQCQSICRNQVIANVFHQMEIMDEWGNGMQLIQQQAQEYGLKKPLLKEKESTICITLYMKTDKIRYKKPIKELEIKGLEELNFRQDKVLNYVQAHGVITNKEARELLKLAPSTVKRFLNAMSKQGLLVKKGENKSRKYYDPNQMETVT